MAAPTTTLFDGSASPTNAPSQGAILLFTDSNCSSPLADEPTPLLYGDCFAVPLEGIKAISVSSFPSCPDYGTPLLLVSDVGSCENSTEGTGADSGVTGECQSYSSGVDINSAEFACFGRGISSAAGSAATSTAAASTAASTAAPSSPPDYDDDDDEGDSCCDDCCCCTVM